MTTILAVVSDTHTNSTVALAAPRLALDDGGEYRASKIQLWLWWRWLEYWAAVRQVRTALGAPVLALFVGDLVDDNRHCTTQLISKNPVDQLNHADLVLRPAMASVDGAAVFRGTEAHTGVSAHLEEIIAGRIATIRPKDAAAWWHMYGEFDGVSLDVAHHPGHGSMRPWTRGGEVSRLAADVVMRYARRRALAPHLALRGHNHRAGDSFETQPTRAIITPSWQLTTAFGHRLGLGGDFEPVGGAIIICHNGTYEIVKHYYEWPVTKPTRVENGEHIQQ